MKNTLWATAVGLVIAVILIAAQGCSRKQVENQLIDATCPAVCDEAKEITLGRCLEICDDLDVEMQGRCHTACDKVVGIVETPCLDQCADVIRESL